MSEVIEYRQTREQCQALIHDVVCTGCGGPLQPLETVDNADHPTFWPGCLHCSCFDYGADQKIVAVARRLVEKHYLRPYSHMKESDYQYLESQTRGAVNIVRDVLREAKAEGLLPLVNSEPNR